MGTINSHLRVVSLGALLAFGGSLQAEDAPKPTKADNTKMNKHAGLSADSQKMNTSDRLLAQKVRKAIVADKALSTYAHNVKVITRDGTVTLKGPVRSDAEKSSVEAKAIEVAGAGKVVNELTVAPKKS